MTFSSSFHMPGAFHADSVHQGLFRPPVSPNSSSGYLSGPAARQQTAVDTTSKRKRTRAEPFSRPREPESLENSSYGGEAFLETPGAEKFQSEPRFYTLAGKLDTPNGGGISLDSGVLGESMFSDSDYRKALGSKRPRDEVENPSSSDPTPLFQLPDQPSPSRGWGTAALGTLGGVMGKMWEFCKAGAFKGFYAGGGTGFEMTPGAGGFAEDASMFDHQPDEYNCGEHRIPGRFPQGEHYFYQEEIREPPAGSGASTPSGPAAKRRQTDQTDDLGRNWVVVTDPQPGSDRRTQRRTSGQRPTPRNRNHTPSVATGRRISTPNARPPSTTPGSTPRRNPNRFSTYTPSPVPLNPPSRPPSSASFASPRPASPSKIPTRVITASAAGAQSHTPRGQGRRRSSVAHSTGYTPSISHRRTNSAASTASSRGNPDDVDNSPRLDAEARQLASRRKMEERDADFRIAAFNKRLQDMIRQGKEALGTTIEVDGDDTGWEDA